WEELWMHLHELPAALQGTEVACSVRAADVAVLVQLERALRASALVNEGVDEDELECTGDDEESLVVTEVAVEPVVAEHERQRVEGVQRVGVVEVRALDRRERRLDLVVVVLARLCDPLVVCRVTSVADAVDVSRLRAGAIDAFNAGNHLTGHVTLDRREEAVLVVVSEHR